MEKSWKMIFLIEWSPCSPVRKAIWHVKSDVASIPKLLILGMSLTWSQVGKWGSRAYKE